MTIIADDTGLDALSKLVLLFYMTRGLNDFKRSALAYFASHLDGFLSLPPEEIQKLCRMGDIDEAAFVAAFQELMMLGPDKLEGRLMN